jgi:hypothetical protein
MSHVQAKKRGEVRLDEGKFGAFPAHQPKPAPGQGPKAGRVGISLKKTNPRQIVALARRSSGEFWFFALEP